jgi:hypothetical protein
MSSVAQVHQVRVTICPPMPAQGAIHDTPQYRRQKELPVHLPKMDADGNYERGLSHADYQHCNIYSHKGGKRRKCLPIPDWTLNDAQTRAVVLTYMERKFSSKTLIGTERERLVRVLQKMKDSSSHLAAQVDRHCAEYVAHLECNSPWCLRRRKALDLQIKVVDGQLVTYSKPSIFYEIVVDYYRTRLLSREIGEQHGVSREAVRTILSRMCGVARELGFESAQMVPASPEVRRMRALQREAYRAARAEERRVRAERKAASRQYLMSAAATAKPERRAEQAAARVANNSQAERGRVELAAAPKQPRAPSWPRTNKAKANIAAGLCPCGAVKQQPTKKLCDVCLTLVAARCAMYKRTRLAAGLCQACGKNKPKADRKRCGACLKYATDASARFRSKRKPAS